jgi:superkiller protein 3
VGRFPDAIKTYQHALKLNPDNASAYCNMGYALMKVGRVQDAIPSFMKTIQLDPTMPQGRTDLAQALRMLGIDPAAPALSGSYPFDMSKALDLLRRFPPPPPQQQ